MPSSLRPRPFVILLVVLGALVASWAAPVAVAAQTPPLPEICLSVSRSATDVAGRSAIGAAVESALATRPVLIPDPLVAVSLDPAEPLRIGVWTDRAALDPGTPPEALSGECDTDAAGDGSWSARISGEFLRAGTKRELAATSTTPGFSSEIDVEWDEPSDRIRTVLTFSGPLGIPNGTCWMDDVISADGTGGTRAETTTDSVTSPFGEGVCGRFDEYLANGGAGAQALVLLPREVDLGDGEVVRFRVDEVDVRDAAVQLAGTITEGEGSSG